MSADATSTIHAVKPSRRQRKPKVKLPPAQAHELDVLRAARMGIDISYMAPDQRCKYPSKFCCNMRARKSTGKLHRLCEFHRSRAKVNQQRWVELRRTQDHTQERVASLLSDTDVKRGNELTRRAEAVPAAYYPLGCYHPRTNSLPATNSHSVCRDSENNVTDASDHEFDMLLAVLAQDEQSSSDGIQKPTSSAGRYDEFSVSPMMWDPQADHMAVALLREI